MALTWGTLHGRGRGRAGGCDPASEDIQVQQDPGLTIEGVITYNIVPFATTFIAKGIFIFCVLPIVLLIVLILWLGMWLGRSSKKRAEVEQAPATAQAPAPTPVGAGSLRVQHLQRLRLR